MRLPVRNGNIIEIRYLLDADPQNRVWHSRIVGERLTNCGKEFPLFQTQLDEPDLVKGPRCESCALLVYNIRALPGDIDFSKLENVRPMSDGMPGNDDGVNFQPGS